MKFFSLLTVTLCATVFCACGPSLPNKKSELMTGEQTAKAAGDSARRAEETGNTGILVGSSNDFIEEKAKPESIPTQAKSTSVENLTGSKVYSAQCASCHGVGSAGKIPLNRYGSGTLEEIMKVVKEGRPKLGMPAWESVLSKEELTAVVEYVFAIQNDIEAPKE